MFNRNNASSGWACVDCLMLLANDETDPSWSEDETAEYLARVESNTAGLEVTLGMFREDHECATNYTVTDTAGNDHEIRADSEEDARAEAEWIVPAGTVLASITPHDLETEADRTGECFCEVNTFSWSACDVCDSPLGGERNAVTFWPVPETAKS